MIFGAMTRHKAGFAADDSPLPAGEGKGEGEVFSANIVLPELAVVPVARPGLTFRLFNYGPDEGRPTL
jgi:hypothetical protein